jgi:hypothetical protein
VPAVFKSPPTDRCKNYGDWDWKDTFVDQVLFVVDWPTRTHGNRRRW